MRKPFLTDFYKAGMTALVILWQLSAIGAHSRPDTLQPVYHYLQDTFCSTQFIIVNNHLYGPDQPSGTETFPGAAQNGADSIVVIDLTFRNPVVVEYQPVVCEFDTLWINGTPYHAGHWLGEEVFAGGAANGCDSILHIDLRFQAAPYREVKDTLCPDDFMEVNGRRYDRSRSSGLEIIAGGSFAGCDSLVYIELFFLEPWLYLGEDQQIVQGDTVCITPLFGQAAVELEWSPSPPCPAPDCIDGCLRPLTSRAYRLTVTDENGCRLTDELRITVSDRNRVFAPNAFNPAGGPRNDRFYLSADAGVTLVRRLLISNRWGETMFEGQGLTPGNDLEGWDGEWNGKDAPPAVYVFFAELERLDGTTFTMSGSFSLVR
jgi:hypothetical protein